MRIVQQMKNPVELCIAECEDGEEIFLSYDRRQDGDYGTGIERDGEGPPTVAWNDPPHAITHPHAQRRGAWYIRTSDKKPDDKKTQDDLDTARVANDESLINDFESMLNDDAEKDCHEWQFENRFVNWRVSGLQGCGDLTMNAWNVAYVNNEIGNRELVHLMNEDFTTRTYTCLVKWKSKLNGRQTPTIEEMRFGALPPAAEVWWDGRWLDRSGEIELAISNQRVIRDGQVVPALETCHQFGDVRHLLQTPNLNPGVPVYVGERPHGGSYLPRRYFGSLQTAAVWLGEQQFVADRSRNLLRAALSGPVVLRWPVAPTWTGPSRPNDIPKLADEGTDLKNGKRQDGVQERDNKREHEEKEQQGRVRGALMSARYTEIRGTSRLLRPGEWRFLYQRSSCLGSSTEIGGLEIHFRRNFYGWTMLGVSSDGRRLLALACQGFPGDQRGYTLEQAAGIFRQSGAYNALLIDEGEDAFQIVDGVDQIKRIRRRVKACFVFAKPLPNPTSLEENHE